MTITKKDVNLLELLVRQVSALVDATPDVLDEPEAVLDTQAWLYRNLAANCATKAKMNESFAKKTRAERDAHNEKVAHRLSRRQSSTKDCRSAAIAAKCRPGQEGAQPCLHSPFSRYASSRPISIRT